MVPLGRLCGTNLLRGDMQFLRVKIRFGSSPSLSMKLDKLLLVTRKVELSCCSLGYFNSIILVKIYWGLSHTALFENRITNSAHDECYISSVHLLV